MCLKLAQCVQAWRIGLFSGCSSTFRDCVSSDEDHLCCEDYPARVMLWADYRLVEVAGGGGSVFLVRRQCCWLDECCVLLRIFIKSKHKAVKVVGENNGIIHI